MNKAYLLRVKNANDIVEVIGKDIQLEQREGRENYFGVCIFGDHKGFVDFEVNPRKQIFKCFHCDFGGDVIKYVQHRDGVPYRTAVATLAKRAGLKAPKERKKDKPLPNDEINPRDLWYGVWVPSWLLSRTEVSANAKLLYGRLCRYYNPITKKCNPKHETIAAEFGVTPRSIRIYINELVEHKLIRPQRYLGPGTPNNYGFLKHAWFSGVAPKRKNRKQPAPGMPDFTD